MDVAIVVVGGGAIGLLVSGALAESGQPVALIARRTTVEALASAPLTIRQGQHTRQVTSFPAVTQPSELPARLRAPRLLILCVKGYDREEAREVLKAFGTFQVLTLQNGVGHEDFLAKHFGPSAVLSGAITSSVELASPGSIVVTKSGGIGLAAFTPHERVEPWDEVLRQAGFPVQVYDDYRKLKWSKALLNMLGNATAAILDMPVQEVYRHPQMIAMERQAFLEGLAILDYLKIHPVNLPGYPAALLALLMRYAPAPLLFPLLRHVVAGGRGGKEPSLLQDLRRGRTRSEGKYLYGAVAGMSELIGRHAPVNTRLWNILKGIASGTIAWDHFRGQPQRLFEVVYAAR